MARAPRQRRALLALFVALALGFAALAVWAAAGAGGSVRRWLVAAAAAAIGLWFLGLVRQLARPH
jgi:hypothetical protein